MQLKTKLCAVILNGRGYRTKSFDHQPHPPYHLLESIVEAVKIRVYILKDFTIIDRA